MCGWSYSDGGLVERHRSLALHEIAARAGGARALSCFGVHYANGISTIGASAASSEVGYIRRSVGFVHIHGPWPPFVFRLGRLRRLARRVPIRDAPVRCFGPDAVAVDLLATNKAGRRVERHPAGLAEEISIFLFSSACRRRATCRTHCRGSRPRGTCRVWGPRRRRRPG